MKILYVTTIGSTMSFFETYIRQLLDEGNRVDIATNECDRKVADCYRTWGCNVFQITSSRSPLSTENVKAVKQIKKIVAEHKYDIVHCHTPIAAACTRLACRGVRKNGVKVFYTAHGFHFYKGAPLKNWLLFYPVEKLCARWTDVLITINKEDYERAKRKLHAKEVTYIPGVGIEIEKFSETCVDVTLKRKGIGVPDDAFLMCSVGELNANKNHETVIKAMAQLERKDFHYVIAGTGDKRECLLELTKQLKLEDRVHLLGYRKDVAELYKVSDIFVFPSFREGLPVSVMEAMAAGLPVVCSMIRGNVDLIDDDGGVFFDPNSVDGCVVAIRRILNRNLRKIGIYNREKASAFSVETINKSMLAIYKS